MFSVYLHYWQLGCGFSTLMVKNVHVIFEMHSRQTKIGTYLKNKFVHDLNEYKLFRETKKKWLQKDRFQYEIFINNI